VAERLRWRLKKGISPKPLQVTREATGVYYEAAAPALYDAGKIVGLANPAQVSALAQSFGIRPKTDGGDSVLLARFGALRQPRAWVRPAPEINELKALLAR
jgi:transposase